MKRILVLLLSCLSVWIYAQVKIPNTYRLVNLDLNSDTSDYGAFLVDDSLVYFTSLRRNGREEELLEYSEKTYLVHYSGEKYGTVRKLGYKLNVDIDASLVGANKTNLFFYRSFFSEEGDNNGELFMAPRISGEKTKSLQKMNEKINSPYNETSITQIGDTFIFASNRSGSLDLYMQTKDDPAIPLANLNSSFDEIDVFATPDGKRLFFASDRPGGKGGYDNYQSTWIGKEWSPPILLDEPFNSPWDDTDLHLYSDSCLFFASNRSGGKGGYDVYATEHIPQSPPKPPVDTVVVKDSIVRQDTVIIKDSILPLSVEPVVPVIVSIILTPCEQVETELARLLGIPKDSLMLRNQYATQARINKTIPEFKIAYHVLQPENSFAIVKDKELCKFVDKHIVHAMKRVIETRDKVMFKSLLPLDSARRPFIEVLNASNHRYAVIVYTQIKGEESYVITKDDQEIFTTK